MVGEQLCYVAEYQGTWLALLGWSAPARHLRPREAWIGWSNEQLARRRRLLANNARFCILADAHQLPNLATRTLGLCTARLSADWQVRCGHPIVAVESFVDGQLFRGTAYKAAGWRRLDDTSGYARVAEDFYERHDRPKQLWVRALEAKAFRGLRPQHLAPAWAVFEKDPPTPRPRCRLPTADYSFGSGTWTPFVNLNQDYLGVKNLVLNGTFRYNLLLPDSEVLRVLYTPEQPISGDKEEVDRDHGDIIEMEFSAAYKLNPAWSASVLYRYGHSFKDKVSGDLGFNYESLEEDTDYTEHVGIPSSCFGDTPYYVDDVRLIEDGP